MYKTSKPLFLICETSLHAGSGDSLGIVDLPIQREKHTSFPKIEASSLKGALREAFEKKFKGDDDGQAKIHRFFGYDKSGVSKKVSDLVGENKDFAGALGFTDARLLLFPVKSMKGIFAWVTCPRILNQFVKDISLAGQTQTPDITYKITGLPNQFSNNQCALLSGQSNLVIGGDKIVLEEFTFEAIPVDAKINQEPLQDWLATKLFSGGDYWHEKTKKDIVVLSDDDFKDFVNLSTEVITRTKIDNTTGTVQGGALFTEEYLPSESVMYSLILAAPEFRKKNDESAKNIMDFFTTTLTDINIFQAGGNATLGKGLLKSRF